jgi:hypothetical protein
LIARARLPLQAMLTSALLSACHGAEPIAGHVKGAALLAGCGAPAQVKSALAAALAEGTAPENAGAGGCVAKAAQAGSSTAAMLLAGAYEQVMTANRQLYAAPIKHGAGPPQTTGLDLFGRRLAWLHTAAEQGYAPAEFALAQATDYPAYAPMLDTPLAWYQLAAEQGDQQALGMITAAYAQGRIADERLYDFKPWLAGQASRGPAYRQALLLLNAAHR